MELDVDGEIGPKTTTRLQKVMGTTQDGTIDGQPSAGQKYWTSILTSVCKWIGGTSEVVFALQKFLIGKGYFCGSSGADGLLGKNTAMALQSFLIKNTAMALQRFLIDSGYSYGKAGVDGYFGTEPRRGRCRGGSTRRSKKCYIDTSKNIHVLRQNGEGTHWRFL